MSLIDIKDEFWIFLLAINNGLILGCFYDFYRVLRYFSRPRKLITAIEDILFWLIVTFITFKFFLNKTDGVIRGFVVLGFLMGFIFYLKIISRYSYSLLKKIFKLILELFNEIIRIISYPFRKMGTVIGKNSNKTLKLIKRTLLDGKKYIKITKKKK